MAVEKIYEICFYGGLMLAILLFIAAVILFVVLKIPRVFGELTGRSAKKGIQDIKKGSDTKLNASKKEQAKYYNQGTGKIKVREAVVDTDEVTDVLNADADDEATDVLRTDADDEATDVLRSDADDEATDVLRSDADDEATDVLRTDADDEATDVLRTDADNEDMTSVLAGTDTARLSRRVSVHYNMVVTHTNETL